MNYLPCDPDDLGECFHVNKTCDGSFDCTNRADEKDCREYLLQKFCACLIVVIFTSIEVFWTYRYPGIHLGLSQDTPGIRIATDSKE